MTDADKLRELAARCVVAANDGGSDALDDEIAKALYPDVVNYDPELWVIRHGGISQDGLCREYALALCAELFLARADLAEKAIANV